MLPISLGTVVAIVIVLWLLGVVWRTGGARAAVRLVWQTESIISSHGAFDPNSIFSDTNPRMIFRAGLKSVSIQTVGSEFQTLKKLRNGSHVTSNYPVDFAVRRSGFYGYRNGYYGPRGMGLMSVLAIVLVIWFVMGGGFGHAMYLRWAFSASGLVIVARIAAAYSVLTDDQRLKNEGKLDQATGKITKAVERVIDKAKG